MRSPGRHSARDQKTKKSFALKRDCLILRIGLCLLLCAGLSVSCRDIEIEPEVPQQQEPEKPEEPKEPETPETPEEPGTPQTPEAPVADLLDIEFFSDGSAKDISASAMAVKHVEGGRSHQLPQQHIFALRGPLQPHTRSWNKCRIL